MSEIDVLQKEIKDLLETVNKDIDNLQTKEPSQRLRTINRCHNKLGEISTRIEAYDLEILSLDKFQQTVHKESIKGLRGRYKELKTKFNQKKAASNGEDSQTADASAINKNLDEMTGQEMIQHGNQVQGKSKDALARIMQNIYSADAKADDINLEIKRQEEVMTRTKEKAQDIQSQLKKSMAYLRYFAKQVYTDKILMCLIILCIIAIIAIIILKITKKTKLGSSDGI